MSAAVLAIYALVYGVMALGRLPGLALERSGAALLGAIAVVVVGAVPAERAWSLVDMSTLYLLFALMVLSAQLRLSGFYTGLAHRLAARRQTPPAVRQASSVVSEQASSTQHTLSSSITHGSGSQLVRISSAS